MMSTTERSSDEIQSELKETIRKHRESQHNITLLEKELSRALLKERLCRCCMGNIRPFYGCGRCEESGACICDWCESCEDCYNAMDPQ
jgi:hypothetical protein